MGRHRLLRGAQPRKSCWVPNQRIIRMSLLRLRKSWTPEDLETRLEPDGELRLALNMVATAEENLIAGCEAVREIGAIVGRAREALSWISGYGPDAGVTFECCVEGAGLRADATREKIMTFIETHYCNELSCLVRRPNLYFCPVCGPVRVAAASEAAVLPKRHIDFAAIARRAVEGDGE